jgi:hypothetical protein
LGTILEKVMSCNCDCHDNEEYDQEVLQEAYIQRWFLGLRDQRMRFRELQDQCALLAQNQYAQSGLIEYRRLEDRITTAFMEWEKSIDGMHERIKKLEDKNEVQN